MSEEFQRIFVEPARFDEREILLNDDERRYLINVLRMKEGASVEVGDGEGNIVRGEIAGCGKNISVAVKQIIKHAEPVTNPLILIQCLPKGDKIKWVLKEATELGVSEIYITISERTVARPSKDDFEYKRERFVEIVKQAAILAGRDRIPKISGPMIFDDLITLFANSSKILFWEEEKSLFREVAKEINWNTSTVVLIGPEGGLSAREVERAKESGFFVAGLGEDILRVETAVGVILALVQYHRRRLG